MAHLAPLSPLFSDLRGVTVRNTFLEFEDAGRDDIFNEGGFGRQVSEPAKPFHRQVSEQTTTGSGATLEEHCADPEDGFSQLAAYVGSTLRHGGFLPPGGQAALHGGAAVGFPGPLQATSPLTAACFCPNCGTEAEPLHRFCPFCCYQLHPFTPAGGPPAPAAPQQCGTRGMMDRAGGHVGGPGLLGCLRRFRFVEANAADVEFARALCMNLVRTATPL